VQDFNKMTITLNLRPEMEAGLLAQAVATGLTLEDYVQRIVEKEVVPVDLEPAPEEGSGMVWENGLYVYGAGTRLPAGFLENAVRRSREERLQQVSGHHD
jgi:hypothetical protein